MTYDAYEISSVQKRMYLVHQVQESNIVYNLPFAWIIEGSLESEKLESSIRKLIRIHESLRTCFVSEDGIINQVVLHELDFQLTYTQAGFQGEKDIDTLLEAFVRPFDLDAPPLWRLELVRLEPEKHVLLFDIHHTIFDGVSVEVFMKHLMTLYGGGEIPEYEFQYVDYTMWHNDLLAGESIKRQEAYWLNRLSRELPKLELVTDYRRSLEPGSDSDIVYFHIDDHLSDGLKQLAKQENVTLYPLLSAAFYVLLYRYTQQEDIIAGSVIHGRTHEEFENIIGMFVNTLALREYPGPGKTFRRFLGEVSQHSLEAFENQDYPFDMLVEKLAPKREANRNPLFDVMFVLQNMDYNIPVSSGAGGQLSVRRHRFRNLTARFDIVLMAYESERKIAFDLEYRTSLFHRETIERMGNHYINLLRSVVENPELELWEIPLMSAEENQRVLIDFNRHDTPYPVNMTLPRLFSLAVEKYPQNIAVVDRDMRELTFKELDERSNLLAANLIGKGIGKNSLVGLSVERSAEMITGILGILKTGAGYVPLNPKAPESRNRYILEDAAVSLVLTGQDIARLSTPDSAGSVSVPFDEPVIDPSGCAYVIYTSGTTGQPKGVPISHSNLMPLLHWGYDKLGISPQDRALQNLSYYFDWSVWEIFFVLTSGARLYMISDEILLNPDAGIDFMLENQITVLHVTPTQYSYFLKAGRKLETLRYLFIGAEKLAHDIVRRSFQSVNSDCRVFNMYGPTEATIISATLEIERDFQEKYKHLSSIPIGCAASNSSHYILDKYMNPVPVNVVGQLYIAGDGLSAGYINNPEQTAQKFISPDSKFIIQNSKLYKTGDMARWVEDGTIEFLGRADQQVKIRGFRIELGEIESRLLQHPDIKEAVVLAPEDENGENYLCAYTVVRTGLQSVPTAHAAQIREFLSQSLPAYMIPAHFIPLEKIPLTPNGKLDSRALPLPGKETAVGIIAPADETEIQLAGIWSGVLGIPVEKIGVDSDFFQLGGHSLKAMLLASRVGGSMDVKLPLAEIFNSPTIKGIARYIKHMKSEDGGYIGIGLHPAAETEYYPVSSVQKRLHVLQQMEKDSTVYNIPLVLQIEGDVDVEKFAHVFRQLVQRHESLRTSFHVVDGNILQKIHHHVDFTLQYNDNWDDTMLHDFIRPFHLEKAPLVRAVLSKKSESKYILMIDMHHIITDATSSQVLQREFFHLYNGRELEPLRIQYKDYSSWESGTEYRELIQRQESYWMETFSGNLPVLNLPLDYPRPDVQDFKGDRIVFHIDPETSSALRLLAKENRITLFTIFLGLYNVLLSKICRQEDILVGNAVGCRRHRDLEQIIGMFVNTIVLRNFPRPEKDFNTLLDEIQASSLEAFENQEYPFEKLVDKLGHHREAGRNPLFDTLYNFVHRDLIAGPNGDESTSLNSKPYDYSLNQAKFDLSLLVGEGKESFACVFEYRIALFKKETIQRFIDYFKYIMETVIRDSAVRLADINLETGLSGSGSNLSGDIDEDFDF